MKFVPFGLRKRRIPANKGSQMVLFFQFKRGFSIFWLLDVSKFSPDDSTTMQWRDLQMKRTTAEAALFERAPKDLRTASRSSRGRLRFKGLNHTHFPRTGSFICNWVGPLALFPGRNCIVAKMFTDGVRKPRKTGNQLYLREKHGKIR